MTASRLAAIGVTINMSVFCLNAFLGLFNLFFGNPWLALLVQFPFCLFNGYMAVRSLGGKLLPF